MAQYVADPDWREQIAQDARDLLNRLSDKGLDRALAACPVSRDGSNGNPPGHLRSSLRRYVEGETARWGTDLNYSVYVEEGHRVAYKDQATGTTVFTGDVVAPQPFLRPSLYELGPEVGPVIEGRGA